MRLSFVLFACVAFLGCDANSIDERHRKAHEMLDRRERAFNEHNLDLYLSTISEEYGGGGTAYTELREGAIKLFDKVKNIRYTTSGRSFYDQPNGDIMAVQRFAMEFDRNKTTLSRSGIERIYLKKQDGFKIVDGL